MKNNFYLEPWKEEQLKSKLEALAKVFNLEIDFNSDNYLEAVGEIEYLLYKISKPKEPVSTEKSVEDILGL